MPIILTIFGFNDPYLLGLELMVFPIIYALVEIRCGTYFFFKIYKGTSPLLILVSDIFRRETTSGITKISKLKRLFFFLFTILGAILTALNLAKRYL